MPPLTTDRRTQERNGDVREYPVKASTTIFAGAMVALDATGHAVPFSTATGLVSLGRAEARLDNSGGIDGAVTGRFKAGIYRFENSAAADQITSADIGSDCYGVDDQTVAKTDGTGTRSVAGRVFDVDAIGVWVEFA
ncbi:hypothetical protein [Roseibium album]|uniref:hypothetical protein n=1 Tax=Roseibium album TaxID=311410 RepID=UPI00249212BC|nr:hypothetical protein [Roseibium album]